MRLIDADKYAERINTHINAIRTSPVLSSVEANKELNPWKDALYDLYRAPIVNPYGWISVEDRLPENGVHCLITCKVKRIDCTHRQYICVGYHSEKFKNLAYGVDDDCVSEYNEEDDEYYISEGWYEVINNWDDYGFVAIDDFVTHWMPLPSPPTEKEN